MKRWVIELPEDTPPQLTGKLTELTEEYIRENFKELFDKAEGGTNEQNN